MRNIARLSDNDRRELFRNTADKMGLNDAIVEKDFWVCFTLDYLFHRCPWKDAITFKGGTSLSKAFNLISRFSEDIDLILDWRVLGYGGDEPWGKRSNTKQDAFNKEANARAEVFLAEQFGPTIQAELSRELGCGQADRYLCLSAPVYEFCYLAGHSFGDRCAGRLDARKNGSNRALCRNLLSESLCAKEYGRSDRCTGADFLGKGNDPTPRGEQTREFGNAAALFPALL